MRRNLQCYHNSCLSGQPRGLLSSLPASWKTRGINYRHVPMPKSSVELCSLKHIFAKLRKTDTDHKSVFNPCKNVTINEAYSATRRNSNISFFFIYRVPWPFSECSPLWHNKCKVFSVVQQVKVIASKPLGFSHPVSQKFLLPQEYLSVCSVSYQQWHPVDGNILNKLALSSLAVPLLPFSLQGKSFVSALFLWPSYSSPQEKNLSDCLMPASLSLKFTQIRKPQTFPLHWRHLNLSKYVQLIWYLVSKNKTRLYKCRDKRGERWSINFLHFALKKCDCRQKSWFYYLFIASHSEHVKLNCEEKNNINCGLKSTSFQMMAISKNVSTLSNATILLILTSSAGLSEINVFGFDRN